MLFRSAGVRGQNVVGQSNASSASNEPIDPSPSIPLPSEGRGRPDSDEGSFAKERRLFADGKFFTADGKAKFLFDPPRPVAEPTCVEFPFVMLTGRGTSSQWHTNTRTGKSDVLRKLYPANAYVEINPADAEHLKISPNGKVAIISRRARVECSAFVTASVRPGNIFVPMHYGITNRLTKSDFDPHSRQPSYKHCAVRVEAV